MRMVVAGGRKVPCMNLQLMPTQFCQHLTIIAEGQEASQGHSKIGCQAFAIILAIT